MWPPLPFSTLDLGCYCWSCDVHLDFVGAALLVRCSWSGAMLLCIRVDECASTSLKWIRWACLGIRCYTWTGLVHPGLKWCKLSGWACLGLRWCTWPEAGHARLVWCNWSGRAMHAGLRWCKLSVWACLGLRWCTWPEAGHAGLVCCTWIGAEAMHAGLVLCTWCGWGYPGSSSASLQTGNSHTLILNIEKKLFHTKLQVHYFLYLAAVK